MSFPLLIFILVRIYAFLTRGTALWAMFDWGVCKLFEQQVQAVSSERTRYSYGPNPAAADLPGATYLTAQERASGAAGAPPTPMSLVNMYPYDAVVSGKRGREGGGRKGVRQEVGLVIAVRAAASTARAS